MEIPVDAVERRLEVRIQAGQVDEGARITEERVKRLQILSIFVQHAPTTLTGAQLSVEQTADALVTAGLMEPGGDLKTMRDIAIGAAGEMLEHERSIANRLASARDSLLGSLGEGPANQ